MNKAKQILKIIFDKEQPQEPKAEEVPNLDFYPELLYYYENGWVELVKGKDGEPFLIDGKRLYQIIDLENGLKESRIIQLNKLFEQSKDFGMTSENVEYNLGLLQSVNQSITDNRNNPEQVLALCNQSRNILEGFRLAKQTRLGDDLIFAIAALVFVFQDEDPSDFIEKDYQNRVKSFQNNELSFFFYTHSFKVLSASLKVYMTDMGSFMKEVMNQSVVLMKRQLSVLTEYLSTDSISISDTQLDYLKRQADSTKLRIRCLEGMLLNFGIGLLPQET